MRSENATENLFINPGGPGSSGVGFLDRIGEDLNTILGGGLHILSFDPRGIHGSTPKAECYPDEETLNTPQTAADMNYILDAIGQKDMFYYGFSYGTILGQTYAIMYHERSKRVIIDGVANLHKCVYVNNTVYGLLGYTNLLRNAIFASLYNPPKQWYDAADKLAKLLQGNATEAFLAYGREELCADISEANQIVMYNDGQSGPDYWPQGRLDLLAEIVPLGNRSLFSLNDVSTYFGKQQAREDSLDDPPPRYLEKNHLGKPVSGPRYKATAEGHGLNSKLLRVNREARDVALAFYRVHLPFFLWSPGTCRVKATTLYLNPEHDVLHLRADAPVKETLVDFFWDMKAYDPKGVGLVKLGLDLEGLCTHDLQYLRRSDLLLIRQRQILVDTLSQLKELWFIYAQDEKLNGADLPVAGRTGCGEEARREQSVAVGYWLFPVEAVGSIGEGERLRDMNFRPCRLLDMRNHPPELLLSSLG
ncbi:hypothetical protein VPNG_08850 [Cytospora leucostoma]|uniref:AB hydrolase-1 domain-containing protein n=1 Tax=Cytospora leucostoma TaxID=1230097 RepID=A0A423VRJ3_9PEZI|nr:hypothetical protein VPNG_08850 [Cytospora leucostoma]